MVRAAHWRARVGAGADTVAFAGVLIGLVAAPFWFGSDRLIAWGVNAGWYGALAMISETGRLVSGRPHPVHVRRLWAPAMAMVAVVLWILAQIAPGLSHPHPLWAMAAAASGQTLETTISVAPDQTLLALLRLTTAILMFWLALQAGRDPARARRLVACVALTGAAYALYGLVAFFALPGTVLWLPKVHYADSLTSTFINRNTYATYAGLGLVCALALAMGRFQIGGDWRRKLAGLVAAAAGPGGVWLAVAFVLGVALALTGSRGGVGASLAGLVLLLALWLLRRRGGSGARAFAALAAVLLIGGALVAFGDFLGDRLVASGLRSDDRLAVYALTLLSIGDAPLAGFGYGTFAQVFPIYRDDSIGPFGLWGRAHNTYVEALQGLGLPAAGLFLAALLLLAGRCVSASLTRAQGATAPTAAAAASLLVGLHAFVDFSLQAQAVALTYAALLGAGVAQSWSSRVSTSQ